MQTPPISAAVFLLAAMLVTAPLSGQQPAADPAVPQPEPVATMSELMIHVIYPASDAIFYITSREPSTSEQWTELEMKALMLAESGNLLMLPYYARDNGQWMRDAGLLREAGRAAFEAARGRDLEALANINDPLYESCVSCHQNYRTDYGRPR